MENTIDKSDIKARIVFLELKKAEQERELKNELHSAYELLKPATLIKNTVKELSSSPDFKGNIMNAVLSLSAGYLSKKIAVGSTKNPIKIFLGSLLQTLVTSGVANNADAIRSGIVKFAKDILNTKEKPA